MAAAKKIKRKNKAKKTRLLLTTTTILLFKFLIIHVVFFKVCLSAWMKTSQKGLSMQKIIQMSIIFA